MKHYLNKQDIIKYLDDITNIKSDKYYVNMMISWAIAESLYINFDQTIKFIEAKNLNRFVQNKAIQKAIESRKIKEDKKEYLRTFKNMNFCNNFNEIKGNEIELKILYRDEGDDEEIPYYYYGIFLPGIKHSIGKISIRIGHNYHSYYNGNIGYEIDVEYQGHNYAYKASQLVIQVAKYHKMDYLILTCDVSNGASAKTIEKLGAKLIEVVMPPKDYLFYNDQMEPHKIYKLEI